MKVSMGPSMADYTVGLDLGQVADYSALVIAERLDLAPETPDGRLGERRDVIHSQRWALGTSYPSIVADVCALMSEPSLEDASLMVDATGVGRGVMDLFNDATRDGRMAGWAYPVSITATLKKDMVSKVQALLQSGRLLIAEAMPLADQLERELVGFRAKNSSAGKVTYEAVTAGVHDDLVTALCLAIYNPGRSSIRRYVSRKGVIYATPELAGDPYL